MILHEHQPARLTRLAADETDDRSARERFLDHAQQLDAIGLQLIQETASASVVGDQHPLSVAHPHRIHMFICRRVFQDRVDVNPAFVRKGRIADIGLMLVRH